MSMCMAPENQRMSVTAILTETDRERITGEADVPDDKRYQSVSRVRNRIQQIEQDVKTLEKHRPDLLEELREVVCDEE